MKQFFIGGCIAALMATPVAANYTVRPVQDRVHPVEDMHVMENPSDKMLAYQMVAIALVSGDPHKTFTWWNEHNGSYGATIIGQRSGKCVEITNTVQQVGYDFVADTMVACKGGGNSNTWIINKKWVISSVTRTMPDVYGCVYRFIDVKIPGIPRDEGITMKLCRTATGWASTSTEIGE